MRISKSYFTAKGILFSPLWVLWFLSHASIGYTAPAQGVLPIPTNTLPSGGQVAQGQANITQNNAVMNINQTTQNAVINWKSFDVGSQAQVNFNQPSASAATLNRVHSATPSMIDGAVRANGQVAFVNPNGIIFGRNAQVDAGGIIASTLDVSDHEFMQQGRMSFKGNGSGKIINQGTLRATGNHAYIALMAPEVQNQGVIVVQHSKQAMVGLASGKQITLEFSGNQLLGVRVDESAYQSLIDNQKLIDVGNGNVVIAANSVNNLMASVVKNSGTIIANAITENGGRILLTGSKIEQSGVIQANSQNAQAGNITLSADHVNIYSGSLTQALGNQNTGVIRIHGVNDHSPVHINIAGQVQASGAVYMNLPKNITGVNQANQIAIPIEVIKTYLQQVNLTTINTSGSQLIVESTGSIMSPMMIAQAAKTTINGLLSTQLIPAIRQVDVGLFEPTFQALPTNSSGSTSHPWIAFGGGEMIVNGRILAPGLASGAVFATGGRIQLNTQNKLLLASTGQILANGSDGGEVMLRSENGELIVRGLIQTNGGSGRGGTILGYGYQTTWIDGATISADGLLQGGDIRLGIDQPSLADRAYLLSDGTGGGSTQGPHILSQLSIIGNRSILSATAIDFIGVGGFIETSGHQLSVQDIQITVTKNNIGQWLLDPSDIIIASQTGADTTKEYVLDSTIINSINNGTNINILATNSITQNVDLIFNNTTSNTATLTYDVSTGNASSWIDINGNISNTGSGVVRFSALTQGGQVRLADNRSINLNGSIILNDQTTQLQINASQLTITKTYNANLGFILSNFVMGSNSFINGNSLTLSNYQNGSSQVGSYAVGNIFGTNTTANLVINPAVLTVTGTASPTKTYDGATSATIVGGTLSGVITADTDNISLVQSGTYTSANAGSNIDVTMTNSLTGSAASNYTLTQPNVTGTINQAVLTVTGTASPTKTYDGTTSATIVGGTLSGVITADTASISLVQSGTYTSANAGSNIDVTMTNSLTGSAAGNYVLTQPVVRGTIIKALLTLSGVKTYDGSATFTIGQMTVGGGVNSESITLTNSYTNSSASAAVYASAVPTGVTWSVAGGNALVANYALPSTASFTINQAPLTIAAKDDTKTYGASSTTVNNVIYNATGVANDIGSTGFVTTGLVSGDSVLSISLSSPGAPSAANVGSYVITPSSADGNGISNYAITYSPGVMTVSQATLTIKATNDTKTYGSGTTSTNNITYSPSGASASSIASLGNGYSVQGLLNSDAVTNITLTSLGGITNQSVDSSPYAITPSSATGTGLGNYVITYQAADSGMTINKATLTITANTQSVTYGTALTLPTSSGFTTTGLVSGDSVDLLALKYNNASSTISGNTQVGTYTNAIVASTASGIGLNNYTISYVPADLTVTQKSLTITASDQTITYGPSWNLGYAAFSASGLVNGDSVNKVTLLQGGSSLIAALKSVGTYSGASVGIIASDAQGAALSNYNITYVPGTLTINKASLTITANNRTITYGGGLDLGTSAFSTSGLMGGDSLTSMALTQNTNTSVPSSQNAGTYSGGSNGIIVTPLSSGTIFSNYAITYLPGTLTINPKQLSVSATKEYNGNNTFEAGQVSITGTIDGQTLQLSGTATGNSANVIGISSMTTSGLSLANGTTGTIGLASNYVLPMSTTQAIITPKSLTVDIVNNPTKIYDGGQVATLGSSNFNITGFIGTQSATINQTTGLYAAPDVLGSNGSSVSAILNAGHYSANTGTGFVASNYLLPLSATGTGTINKATLTITAYSGWKYIGQSDPSFNYYVTGGVNGSNPVSSATVTRTNASVQNANNNHQLAGIYTNAIVPSNAQGAGLSNYDVNYANNTFTIVDKNQIVITTNSNQINYGIANSPATLPSSPVISAQYCVVDCTVAGNIKTLTLDSSSSYVNQNNGSIRVPNGLINTTIAVLQDTYSGNGTIAVTVGQDELQMDNSKSSSGYYRAGTYGYQMASGVPTISGTIVTLNTTQNIINEPTSSTPTSSSNTFSGFYNFLGNLTISPATITPSANSITKVYDGTVTATPSLVSSGKITGDVVNLNSPYSTYASKNVLAATSYTSMGLFLSGTDAVNYILSATSVTHNASTITKAPILIAGLQASDKTYNGNTVASVTGASNSRLITPFKGDTVTLSASGDTLNCSSACTFDTANVYSSKPVTVTQEVLRSNFSLGGTDASNYEISGVAINLSANILPAPLYVSGLSAQNKIYNANTTAVITQGTPTVTGTVYGGDLISQFSTIGTFSGTGSFTTQNVGTGITVTPNLVGLGLSGTNFSNYYLAGTSSPLTANITQAPLTIGGLTTQNKVYDTNLFGVLTGTPLILAGIQGSDSLSLLGTVNSGTFNDKDVSSTKNITADLSGLNLMGGAASNYYFSPLVLTADITAAPVIFSGSKQYDGSRDFSSAQLAVKGVYGETLNLASQGSLTSNSANVGGESAIASLTNLQLVNGTNGLANNYTLVGYSAGLLTITPAPITISPASITKVYDGSTSASTNVSVNVGSLYHNSSNSGTLDSIIASFNYSDKNVGTNKTVTASNIVVNDGNSGRNYQVTNNANTTSAITQKDLIITPNNISKTYATNDPSLTYSISGLATGDTNSIFTGGLKRAGTTGAQQSSSVAEEAVGDYSIGIGTLSASNYNLILDSTPKYLTINKYVTPLRVIAQSKTKVYGLEDPELTYSVSGFVINKTIDGVLINDSPASFLTGSIARATGENVGTYAINQGTLSANNYNISYTANNLTINKAPLSVTADSKSKTYGDADPSLTYTSSGLVNRVVNGIQISDTTSSVLSGSLTRVAGETVASSPYRINQGSLVSNGNYQLSYIFNNLTINKANLTAVGTQVYNGTTLFNAGSFTSVTGVNGQTFTVSSGTATLSNSGNVQTNQQPNSLNGIVLSGVNGSLTSNYNTLSAAQTSLSVTPANFTAVGTQVYNGTTTFNAESFTSVTGVNGQTFTVSSGTATLSNSGNVQTNQRPNSLNDIVLSGVNGSLTSNYNMLTAAQTSLSVTPANLSAVGTQVYNGTTTFNTESFTSVTGVNGQTFTVSSGTATLSNSGNVQTNQQPNSLNGIVLSSMNGSLTSNYNTLTTSQTSLTVTPASYTAISGTKIYDGINGIINNAVLTGVNGETFTVSATANSLNAVGATKFATIGSSLTGNTNYLPSSVNGILSSTTHNTATITPASYTAITGTKAYDGINGIINNATLTGVNDETFTVSATANSLNVLDATKFTTIGTSLSANTNYVPTSVNSILSGTLNNRARITAVNLNITANDQTTTYGTARNLGSSAFTATGLVNGEVISGVTLLQGNNSTVPSTQSAGSYSGSQGILASNAQGTLSFDNYNVTYQSGTLLVQPKKLVITADSYEINFGVNDPALTYSVTGYVNNDETRIRPLGNLTRTAENTSLGRLSGSYDILQGSLNLSNSSNYEITYNPGSLVIRPSPDVPRIYASTRTTDSMSDERGSNNLLIAHFKEFETRTNNDASTTMRFIGNSKHVAYDGSSRLELSIETGNVYEDLHPENHPAADDFYNSSSR